MKGNKLKRAGDETRTRDNLLGRQALYQLSYSRTFLRTYERYFSTLNLKGQF